MKHVKPRADFGHTARVFARAAFGLRLPKLSKGRPGAAPGIQHEELATLPSRPGGVKVTVVDYAVGRVEAFVVDDIAAFVAKHRPEWSAVRWINVDGLTDMTVLQAIAEKYQLHPLALEDMLHVPQRPKVETYGEGPSGGDRSQPARLFVVARMTQLVGGQLDLEQISFFIGHKTLLTFQEKPGDLFDPIRRRLNAPRSQLLSNDASFLLYALLDSIVDHCFPVLEYYGSRLEELEDELLTRPNDALIQRIHRLRRELLLFRREMWPMREVLHTLQRESHECLHDTTRMYLRDVYDHMIQILELSETYRELASGLTETYMSSLSIRMNEVMKVLTMIATIFIPITFLAGVYGMNFRNFPELDWRWGYASFWMVCASAGVGMLIWFKRKGWL
jgi:magnesium transporter